MAAGHGGIMANPFFCMVRSPRHLFYFGGCFIRRTVQRSPQGDGSQQVGSDAAIESSWRLKLVETWPFLLD